MPAELTMPKLSDSEADIVIIRWLKTPGEGFRRGEALMEVETDKATVVFEAEDDGTLEAILVSEGESAAVGQPIARLAGDGRRGPGRATASRLAGLRRTARRRQASARTRPRSRAARRWSSASRSTTSPGPGPAAGSRARTCAALRPRRAAPARAGGDARAGTSRVVELTPTQPTIARRMAQSAAEIPTFTVSADADVSQVVALRRGAREESQAAPSLNDFVVKAAALALREFPRFNASYVDGKDRALLARQRRRRRVAVDDALLVPVVSDADRRTLAEIAAETRRLADGARSRSLRPEELRGGTFTVSQPRDVRGALVHRDRRRPQQAAILAVGCGAPRRPFEDDARRRRLPRRDDAHAELRPPGRLRRRRRPLPVPRLRAARAAAGARPLMAPIAVPHRDPRRARRGARRRRARDPLRRGRRRRRRRLRHDARPLREVRPAARLRHARSRSSRSPAPPSARP